MKKITLTIALLLSPATYADTVCADIIGAVKSSDFRKVYSLYNKGINDMDYIDSLKYAKRFNSASDGTEKTGKRWMMQRAIMKCQRVELDTKLSNVIKVTM